MPRQAIDVGISGTPTSGESLRNALGKVNTMTAEIYPAIDAAALGVTNRGDVSVTLASTDNPTQNFNTTLTVNRTVTLPTTVGNRTRFRISRTAVTPGAFILAVGTLYSIAASAREWVDVEYDGAAWFVSARGGL